MLVQFLGRHIVEALHAARVRLLGDTQVLHILWKSISEKEYSEDYVSITHKAQPVRASRVVRACVAILAEEIREAVGVHLSAERMVVVCVQEQC